MAGDQRDLSRLSLDELLQEYVRHVQLCAATDHVGRLNRLAKQQRRILEALKSRAERTLRDLLPLRTHQDPAVQLSATILCKSLDRETYEQVVARFAKGSGPLARRARDSVFMDEWLKEHPPTPPKPAQYTEKNFWQAGLAVPAGITRADLEARVRQTLPDALATTIVESIRPAIGVWPRRAIQGDSHAHSRLGGLPSIPAGWRWPTYEMEPLLFIGQINCAELHGFANASLLPPEGLISFFADYDATIGCASDVAAVFYWPPDEPLEIAAEPIEDSQQMPGCGLAFYETFAVPDLISNQVAELKLDKPQRRTYGDLKEAARSSGVSHSRFDSFHTSKLFGWPDLVQRDLECLWSLDGESRSQLLLQVGWYDNGSEI